MNKDDLANNTLEHNSDGKPDDHNNGSCKALFTLLHITILSVSKVIRKGLPFTPLLANCGKTDAVTDVRIRLDI